MTHVGILGGGQLGRMLIQAAVDFPVHIHVLDPDPQAPCRHLAHRFVCGHLHDFDTVYQFGKGLDVLTIEIEKVNTQALEVLEREGVRVHPSPAAIALIQDKRRQKEFYREHHIPTAPFVLTDDRQHALQLASDWLPAFHKLGRDGYDGKGVVYLPDASGLDHLFDAPGVLERAIPVHQELSVIVARGGDGSMRSFPAVEMVFNPAYHLLDYLLAPARIGVGQAMEAQLLAERLADTLGIVGLLAVEMFVTPEGRLLVNEVAPRPHNSGHHTIRANYTSQYEQHLRAILGLPLGSPEATVPAAAIVNLIGAIGHSGPVCYTGLSQVLATEGCYIHLYGKAITKPGRKMGHLTLLAPDLHILQQRIEATRQAIRVEAVPDLAR